MSLGACMGMPRFFFPAILTKGTHFVTSFFLLWATTPSPNEKGMVLLRKERIIPHIGVNSFLYVTVDPIEKGG